MLMRIFCALMIFSSAVFSALAQSSPSPSPSPTPIQFSAQTIAELKKLQQAALTSDYAYRQVAHLSNNIGPRLSGSVQAQKAVEYVADEMKALGLEVKLEKVMVPHWVRGEETGALIEFPGMATGTTQKLFLTALGGSVATPTEGLTAEVVVAKNFAELQSLGREKVAGKIVIFTYAYDKAMAAQGHAGDAYGAAVDYRTHGASAAARLGAVASLIRSAGSADYRLPHTGAMRYDDDAPKIPAGALAAEDTEMIAALAAQGPVKMRLLMTPQTLPEAESFNVVADLKGRTNPEQVVIVSGHLDSWDLGRGSLDDGAGVAVAMQVPNLIKQLKLQPKRTIRVVAWMNEENGLRGANGYAKDHAAELANHVGALETDGGAGHPLGLNIRGHREAVKFLAPMAEVLEEIGAGLLNPTDHTGADVSPLEPAGVTTFHPMQDSRTYFQYHHSAADTLDKIEPRLLSENAAVNVVLAYALANSEQPLPHAETTR